MALSGSVRLESDSAAGRIVKWFGFLRCDGCASPTAPPIRPSSLPQRPRGYRRLYVIGFRSVG